jgi:DNA-binding NtrC family response regulator
VTASDLDVYLDGHDNGSTPSNLPVHLGKSPEESSRDLLYWAILEVARDVKELKAYLIENGSSVGQIKPLPVYQSEETPIERGTEIEFSETGSGLQRQIKTMDEVERDAILGALQATHGHRQQAARLLDMAERTLYRKIRQYGL